ncbi:MAG: isocitrate/isopropylmalate family dehydrogenase [Pseudomonadota bacterium]
MLNTPHRVLVIPGDGIGVEVTGAMLEVLDAVGLDWTLDVRRDINSETWLKSQTGIPEPLMAELKSGRYGAILFGAIGDPRAPEGVVERATLLRLRFELNLALNVRPLRLPAGLPSVLASGNRIDAVVVRENTEGAYSGASGSIHRGSEHEVAVTTSISTRTGARAALAHGFRLAKERRGDMCLVHKANVLQDEGRLWRSEADAQARENPGVVARYMHADAAAMRLITHPQEFDVIVTDNLFGDLLTDLGAALSGGIGLAASSNVNPWTNLALFEPIHGTAPDIAGKGLANPLAMIRCLGMCARHLGEMTVAQRILDATDAAAVRTGARTSDYLEAVVGALG